MWRQCLQWVDSVEKLKTFAPKGIGRKIDLSDRLRIDDREVGKGVNTPQNLDKVLLTEFFNRIGRMLPVL